MITHEVPRKFIECIEEEGYLTGSRALLVAKETSDYDYLIKLESDLGDEIYENYQSNTKKYIKITEYNGDIKFLTYRFKSSEIEEDKEYNVILCVDEYSFTGWKMATDVCKGLIGIASLNSKFERESFFASVFSAYKDNISK